MTGGVKAISLIEVRMPLPCRNHFNEITNDKLSRYALEQKIDDLRRNLPHTNVKLTHYYNTKVKII